MIFLGLMLAASTPAHDPRCDSMQTSDLIACADADLSAADGALNAQWKEAQAKASAQDKDMDAAAQAGNGGISFSQSLLASERAWIAYRDAQCRFETYRNFGGRELPIYQAGCRANLTKQRTQELKDFTEGQ